MSTSAAIAAHGKNVHRSRTASAFLFPDTADYLEPSNHPSAAPSPRPQVLSGTDSPCGSWISLSARELLEDDYSEIDYSDMDGEDDMIYDSPPYYYDEEELLQHQYQQQQLLHQQQIQYHNQHSYQQQHHQHPPGRPLAFAGKGDYAGFPASSSSSSHHSSQEQEQAEEALRASLSTLLSSGPRPRFRQRRNRPRKIYTVDTRSQRSSPLVPASPTHLYYSSSSSPHLRPSNPESILGDLSPHYFHGAITPISRDYDSASSDSEVGRQKKVCHRGILSTGQPMREHYYDIESTTLNSSDPTFSGSTTPLNSPHYSKSHTPPDSAANKVLQGPSSLLATRYVSWSVKAQSILDHAAKEPPLKSGDGHSSTFSSRSSSPHSSPSSSGASTPSRTRRRRCPIPEPHQGFFSRALDQRSLASHVSVSRVGMAGTMCPPLHVGLRTGILIRGSSPLRPIGTNQPSCSSQNNSSARSYSFKNMSGGALANKGDNNCDLDIDAGDDKENKRWYSQELGLNLWQTTLGAAALLGTGFGSGMVKKVHNITQDHMMDIRQAISESNATKVETGGAVSRYVIRITIDPLELLQTCANLGNKLLCDIESIEPDVHLVCCQILQQFMSLDENSLLAEQVRMQFAVYCFYGVVFEGGHYSGQGQLFKIRDTLWTSHFRIHDGTHHQQKITVECLGAHRAEGCFVNQMELFLLDDLADSAKLGEHIQLIGRVYRSYPEKNQETYLHGIQMDVNNLIHLPSRRDEETLSEAIAAIATSDMSPWNTSQTIVDLFDGIVPTSIYRKLKLALLLSAVSVAPSGSKNLVAEKEVADSVRRSIHVLVVMNGRDTIVPALMASMAGLKNCIFWDHGDETTRKTLHSLHQPKKPSIGEIRASEMGAARDGVVLFELDQLDKKAQAHITSVLTTANGNDIGIQRDNLSLQLELTCCCWATHTSIPLPSKKPKPGDPVFEEDITGSAHKVPLNEKFDIIVGQHELDAVSDVALAVAAHTLRRYMQDDEGGDGPSKQLSREDLSQYLHVASTIEVRLSTECEQLLRAYFQVMRKKASGSHINRLSSLSTMSTLLNVACCHAKVCLRSGANRYDALVSIMMMEETIAARWGTSCLGFVPLLDGKENVTRLYAQSEPIDILSIQGQAHDLAATRVPVFLSSFEMDVDMTDPSSVMATDADVPVSLQETRDQVMDAMYAHLTRVISEYADTKFQFFSFTPSLQRYNLRVQYDSPHTNAITILVRAGVAFHGADLRGIKIPGADLSCGQFDSAQLQGADLTGVDLSRSWLRQTNLSHAQLEGVQFGELPYLKVEATVEACAYSPDGRMLGIAIWGDGIGIGIYDTSTWQRIHLITATDADRRVMLWDASTGAFVSSFDGHSDTVHDVTFSLDGLTIASGSADGTVRLWEASSSSSRIAIQNQIGDADEVAYSPDGLSIFSFVHPGIIRQGDATTGLHGSVSFKFPDPESINTLTFSSDGNRIAAGCGDDAVRLWDRSTGAAGPVLEGHSRAVVILAYSTCGRWIASSDDDGIVRLWDLHNTEQQCVLFGDGDNNDRVFDLKFSPTGHQLAICSEDGKVLLFDPRTRVLLTSKKLKEEAILALDYSPNGQLLAIGTLRSIALWDLRSDELCIELKMPRSSMDRYVDSMTIAYSPCGQFLASSNKDYIVHLWQRHSTKGNEIWSCAVALRVFSAQVVSLSWNPVVPTEFITASNDGSVRVWRVSSGDGTAVVRMFWGTNLRILCTAGVVLEGATSLSPSQYKLISQRHVFDKGPSSEDD
ncbi:Minichromosome maintenance domain-containing protein 2 [Linnemannia hyalina]|uniref:Minichromosome maintenance domain-containing protein 2 n=1 Tax=Linnemannia hyalina TaxID=64524 RepID=A0A9P7XZX1_9FUNG|nr:Minichromosome maintenance domain-containing protein 2 [Linnemannia hyalina]